MPLSNGPSLQEPTSFGLSAISHMVGASDESSIPSDTIGKSAGLCPTALELQCAALEDRKWKKKVNRGTPKHSAVRYDHHGHDARAGNSVERKTVFLSVLRGWSQ